MSDFKTSFGFQDCWTMPKSARSVATPASGYFDLRIRKSKDKVDNKPKNTEACTGGRQKAAPASISSVDKARLARVVKGVPEVMVKVSRPAKNDKRGNPIHVTRATEAVRVGEHLSYISRNGKIELENDRGEMFDGKQEVAELYREWIEKHDDARRAGEATDRTRMTRGIVFSMPGFVNAETVKDSVRAVAVEAFGGHYDYVMALHTDTRHPHVHLTVRTVGYDGVKLNLRKDDLQHLRDIFAEKLRGHGVEAESTPRHARGVTQRGETTSVYKIRQRGEKSFMYTRKQREVQRDLNDNGGHLPQKPWDDALVARRNRVMRTYGNAVKILEQSDDPMDWQLAKATKEFSARLTDVTTQRGEIARTLEQEKRANHLGKDAGQGGVPKSREVLKARRDRGGGVKDDALQRVA
nr:relaxase/mobilization nuclease domain-containing protein [uncultured Celeribacter sp.]